MTNLRPLSIRPKPLLLKNLSSQRIICMYIYLSHSLPKIYRIPIHAYQPFTSAAPAGRITAKPLNRTSPLVPLGSALASNAIRPSRQQKQLMFALCFDKSNKPNLKKKHLYCIVYGVSYNYFMCPVNHPCLCGRVHKFSILCSVTICKQATLHPILTSGQTKVSINISLG